MSLNGMLFEADAALVAHIVVLRYDPTAPASRGVELWHEGRFVTKIHPVLVVDEAQHLRNDVLEDLRLLTNYAMDAERRLNKPKEFRVFVFIAEPRYRRL